MHILRVALFLAAALFGIASQGELGSTVQVADDPFWVVHEALFSSFLPIAELQQDARVSALMIGAREGIWLSAKESSGFRQLLAPFADLRDFRTSCGIASYLQPHFPGVLSSPIDATGSVSFASLTPAEREHVLFLLGSCDQNEARRLAMSVRNFYIVRAYGAIQEPLTGVRLNLAAPHDWIEQHRPNLAPSRLRYDREKREIISSDRAIDYLVVGSGPAGSVLAHELRRGGKRVVLVERGPFIVPGSIESRLTGELIDTRTSGDGAILIRNGIAVGGGSQVNVDLCFAPTLPAIQVRIEGWRREGKIGSGDFTYRQLAAAYAWVKKSIGTRTLSESEINTNNRALWDGARRDGLHPKLYDLNAYAPDHSPYPVTDKRSSESQLLIESMEDKESTQHDSGCGRASRTS